MWCLTVIDNKTANISDNDFMSGLSLVWGQALKSTFKKFLPLPNNFMAEKPQISLIAVSRKDIFCRCAGLTA